MTSTLRWEAVALLSFAIPIVSCAPLDPEEETAHRDSALASSVSARVVGTGGLGLRVRAEPNTTSAQIGSLWDGDLVSIVCRTRGELIDGTNLWNQIATPPGFVLDAYIESSGRPVRCRKADEGELPQADPTPASGPTTGPFDAIWGGVAASVTFEFLSPGGLYAYGTEYGLDGVGHTGVDVGVGFGTTLYAPTAGEVTCAGTDDGPGTNGGGCAAFRDTGDGGPYAASVGVGRIELLLDDGTVLILGHSRTASVRPGQRVERGTPVGTSGGMNGAHVHVEARIRDATTRSGWRIVDPRTRFAR